MNKLKILALDLAAKTGWSVDNVTYGMENFTPRSGESAGWKLIRFKSFLIKILETEKINLVVYERAGGRFKNDIMSSAKFIAVLEIVCIEQKIEYRAYSAGEIKLHATGKGNSGKPAMIKAAIRKFKKPITDDNIADAMWLCDLAKKDLS